MRVIGWHRVGWCIVPKRAIVIISELMNLAAAHVLRLIVALGMLRLFSISPFDGGFQCYVFIGADTNWGLNDSDVTWRYITGDHMFRLGGYVSLGQWLWTSENKYSTNLK